MATGTSVKFDASRHAVVVLLGLGAILVLPLARMPLLKLHWQRATSVLPSCVCYLAHLGPHLYSKGSCVRITTLAQLPSRHHAVQKRWSCEVVGSDQFPIWYFMNSGIVLEFNANAVVVLLGLGAILVLPLARMPLLKLYCQGATIVFPSRACHLSRLGPHLYIKSGCTRTTLGQLPE